MPLPTRPTVARRALSFLAMAAVALSTSGVSLAAADPAVVAMNRRIGELKLDGVALGDALDFLRDSSGANFVVQWKVLEAAGVSRDLPITLRLRDVTLRKALAMVLAETGSSSPLAFQASEGVIEVTTLEVLDKKLVTRIYPVGDLLFVPRDAEQAPQFNLQLQQSASRGGGGGNQIFNGGGSSGQRTDDANARQTRGDELVALIKATVRPEIWNENGGPAAIRFYQNSLIVTAPESVHDLIGSISN